MEVFFNLNPINFLIATGLIQNFIIAAILFFKRSENPLANRLLAVAITIVNLHLTYLVVLDTNLDNMFSFLLWVPYSCLSAVGPLIFFYTKALTNPVFSLSGRESKHFIPVAIEVGVQLIMIIQAIRSKELFYNTPFYFYLMPLVYAWTVGSLYYYIRQAVSVINHHESWALRNFSNLRNITLAWLKKMVRYYRILLMVWIPFVSSFLLFFRFQLMYLVIVLMLYAFMLVLTYLTFWIALQGWGHGRLMALAPAEPQTENKNFSKLSTNQLQEHIDRITQAMTAERIYLNENLSLRDLASHLDADSNLISFVLNKHLNNNFHDFVNYYRIEEVKNRLRDPKYRHLTILGIALESGFNSKTTFNRVFKQLTGFTPSEYQKTQQKTA